MTETYSLAPKMIPLKALSFISNQPIYSELFSP